MLNEGPMLLPYNLIFTNYLCNDSILQMSSQGGTES